MHRKRDKEVSQHSAEDRTTEFGCVRWDARAAVQEKERWDTGGLTANNDRTVTEYHTVVLKASADHAVVESRRREDRTAFSERQW